MIKPKPLKVYIATLIFIVIANDDLRSLAETSSRELLIVYSGNTLGELKPCGCTEEEDQGGFERRMTYLKQISKSVKLF